MVSLVDVSFIIFLSICIFVLGIIVGEIYDLDELLKSTGNEYDGYWLKGGNEYDGYWLKGANETEAKDFVNSRDPFGHWICVNINNMTYERMVEVCQHEVGHEIFATICQNDMERCFEISNEN
jgi:hypothetical protein